MKRPTLAATAVAAILLGFVAPASTAGASASSNRITGRVSALPGLVEPSVKGDSDNLDVSGNGRYVVFRSAARFTAADQDSLDDVYLRDLLTDQVELISVATDGSSGNGDSFDAHISDDGRYVAFVSHATNLLPTDANGSDTDVFVRDRKTGTTVLASKSSSGVALSKASSVLSDIAFSGNGRYVVFNTSAPELISPASNTLHMYVRDLVNNFTERVSVSSTSVLANNNSFNPSISADGRYVAYATLATNLGLSADANGSYRDIFVRDRTLSTTSIASLTDSDVQAPSGDSDYPSISNDGQKVAFEGDGAMAPGDTTAVTDVFVRNRATATTTKISTKLGGGEADQDARSPDLSADGTTVVWSSTAGEYIAGGGNGVGHVFKRVGVGAITRESVTTAGALASGGPSFAPVVSSDGSVVAFASAATNLASGDTGFVDVFVRRNPEVGPHGNTATYASAILPRFTGTTDGAAIGAMTNRIAGGSSPEREVLLLAQATSFAGKRPYLVRLYVAYFGRLPDTGGLNYWTNKMKNGMKLDQVSSQFAGSSEFKTKYGNTTNSQFVTLVYNNVLGRSPDAAGLSFWVNKMANGMKRGTVMTNFSESSEGKRRFQPYVDTSLVSLGLLGKLPPTTLANATLTDMTTDSSELGVQRLIKSPEYAATT